MVTVWAQSRQRGPRAEEHSFVDPVKHLAYTVTTMVSLSQHGGLGSSLQAHLRVALRSLPLSAVRALPVGVENRVN